MLKGFKDFIARGNVIDLAVGVIMGGAFGAIVTSLVTDVITPILGMVFGKPDFSGIVVGSIMIGESLNAVIAFLLIAIGVYFFIVVPINKLKGPPPAAPPPGPPPQEKLLTEIR